MPRRSRRARPDANQPEIFDGLRRAGYLVEDTSAVGYGFPDAVVGTPWDTMATLEVKSEDGELRPSQVKWSLKWHRFPRVVARTLAEALAGFEALRDRTPLRS